MKKIKDFWLHSYHTDKVAFAFELVSFIFTVGASLTLASTADNPQMEYIYPGFFLGSWTAVYAYYRRKLAWPMALTTYFGFVNVFGFGVALGWW